MSYPLISPLPFLVIAHHASCTRSHKTRISSYFRYFLSLSLSFLLLLLLLLLLIYSIYILINKGPRKRILHWRALLSSWWQTPRFRSRTLSYSMHVIIQYLNVSSDGTQKWTHPPFLGHLAFVHRVTTILPHNNSECPKRCRFDLSVGVCGCIGKPIFTCFIKCCSGKYREGQDKRN